MNSLQGIFDSGRPTSKRNFIQENVRQLRTLQKAWKKKEGNAELPPKSNKFQHISAKVPAHVTPSVAPKQRDIPSAHTVERSRSSNVPTRASTSSAVSTTQSAGPWNRMGKKVLTKTMPARKSQIYPVSAGIQSNALENHHSSKKLNNGTVLPPKKNPVTKSLSTLSLSRSPLEGSQEESGTVHRAVSENSISVQPVRSLGCQTLSPEDEEGMFNEGVIKYPSTCNLGVVQAESSSKIGRPPTCDSAQQTESSLQTSVPPTKTSTTHRNPVPLNNIIPTSPKLQNALQVHQSVHERLLERFKGMSIGDSKNRPSSTLMLRTSARKGRHRERMADILQNQSPDVDKAPQKSGEISDPACPEGHVPLPEAERLETLRMLRKSYEDQIRQLNSLPVKTDTLKMRLRKIDIEKQLNKLEEGIKVFSRPKVFVKIGV